jgi:carboxyl-terminal processing protease
MAKQPANIKRITLAAVLLFSMSCSLVTRVPATPTATRVPTLAPSEIAAPATTAIAILPPTASPTVYLTPTEASMAPSYVPPSCQGKPVATISPAQAAGQPTPGLKVNPSISKDEQIKVFEDLVAKITEVYLYPDFTGLDWPGLVAQYRAKVKAGLDSEAFYTAMEKLVFTLNDDHSNFESPVMVAESNAELSGVNDFVGVGVRVNPVVNQARASILAVFPDSPAEHSGLKPHDSILFVDGLPIVEKGIVHTERVRGPECSAVVLTIQSPGGQPRQVLLIRFQITTNLPINAQLVPTSDGSRIGYIFLPTFYDDTIPGQVKQALENFGNLDALILDNRMNSGGASNVVEPILSYFTSGTLGNFISRKSTRPFTITANPVNNSQTVPLVVLAGPDTVSFGEIFSGILQDQGRAKIVGQTTMGNVETLHGYNFEDGSRAWIAEERFDPIHSHAIWEKNGVKPDVVAYADWDTFTFENDPSIAAALKLLGHR